MERTTIRPITGGAAPIDRRGGGRREGVNRDPRDRHGPAERDLLEKADDARATRSEPAESAGSGDGEPGRRPSSVPEPRDDHHSDQPFPIRIAPEVAVAAGLDPFPPDTVPAEAAARLYHRQAVVMGRVRPGSMRPLGRMTDEEA